MWIFETFIFSFKIMLENKVRSLLTMLGIIVGISSLLLIVVMGNSFKDTFNNITKDLYKNNQAYIFIEPSDTNNNVVYDEYGMAVIPKDVGLDIRDINEFLQRDIAGNSYEASGTTLGMGSSTYKGKSVDYMVRSANPDEVSYSSLTILQGRDVSVADVNKGASTGLICSAAAEYLFGNENPIGKEITIECNDYSIPVIVVGVYQSEMPMTAEMASNMMTLAFINHSYIENQFSGALSDDYYRREYTIISLEDVENLQLFKNEAISYFDSLLDGENWHVGIQLMSESFQAIEEMLDIIINIIFGIACISLFIGGIGVMNVMLVTVTERTNEIGTRKAIGSTNGLILFQFLTESFVITVSGAFLGVVIGMGLSKIIADIAGRLLQMQLKIPVSINVSLPLNMVLFSVVISIVIGVVFGMYPAVRATRMQVVDALRYE